MISYTELDEEWGQVSMSVYLCKLAGVVGEIDVGSHNASMRLFDIACKKSRDVPIEYVARIAVAGGQPGRRDHMLSRPEIQTRKPFVFRKWN